jgi:hypothetical protein
MLILVHKYGQLGNRLAYLRAFISFALENNIRILDLSFDEYAKYFREKNNNIIKINRILAKVIRKLLMKAICYRLINEDSVLLTTVRPDADTCLKLFDDDIFQKLINENVVIYDGWPVIRGNVLTNNDEAVRKYFKIPSTMTKKINNIVSEARRNCEILIGIHIRQGDYKYWHDGKYYFSTKVYVDIMKKVKEYHHDKKITFVISSNENQDWKQFSSLSYIKATGDAVEDMYLLAACDEIYGPKSSFSGWASFYGNVPICWIDNPYNFSIACKKMD